MQAELRKRTYGLYVLKVPTGTEEPFWLGNLKIQTPGG
jgi:hypothetical protein